MVSLVKMSMANKLHLLILILAALAVHGCGFQLRGALDLSKDIAPLYIQQNSAFELAREIKLLLEKNKIAVTEAPAGANAQLALLSENKKSRVLSVDANGRAREYQLTYTVNVAIKIRQSKEVQDSISLSRSLLFDSDAVLAVTNESEILYRDMRKDAARLILLKLQARSKNQLAADEGNPVDSPASAQELNSPNSMGNSTGGSNGL
jgi:LPS-assembly lipoprotein